MSPKVYAPAIAAVIAGIVLWVLTGDRSALIVSLTGIAGGGIGAIAPPAPGVTQHQVHHLARRRRR